MTIQEYYESIGGDYEEALERLLTEDRVKKYIYRFTESKCYAQLCEAMREHRYQEAFMAAHSLKGIAANISYKKLYEQSSLLTEELRDQNPSPAAETYFDNIQKLYQTIMDNLPKIA